MNDQEKLYILKDVAVELRKLMKTKKWKDFEWEIAELLADETNNSHSWEELGDGQVLELLYALSKIGK